MRLVQRPLHKLVKVTVTAGLGLGMVCGLLILFGRLALPVMAAPLGTPLSCFISSPTTLTLAGSPYTVNCAADIQALLTIQPGVVVSFTTNSSQLIVQPSGRLVASGTPTQPIMFTGNPGMCSWLGIELQSDSNVVEYAFFEYAKYALKIEVGSDFNTIAFNRFQNNGGCASNPLSGAVVGSTDNSAINDNIFNNNNTAIYLSKSSNNTLARNLISTTTLVGLSFFPSAGTRSSNNTVVSNTVSHAGEFGIYMTVGDNNSILENKVFSNTAGGIGLDDQNATSGNRVTVRNNDIYSNTGLGLYITGTGGLDLGENLVLRNGQGVLWDLNNIPGAVITRNVICRNTAYLFRNADAASVTAARNWWGTNNPSIAGDIQGPVVIDPRLVLSATTGATVLPANGVSTTTLTVSLQGGGETVPPRARTITLTTTLGNISPAVVTLNNSGIATATYTSAITPGSVTITAGDICTSTLLTPSLVITPVYNLAITKTAALAQVMPGQTVTYTIQYSNTSNQPASGVVISDVLPAFSTFVDDNSGLPRNISGSGSISWTVGSLAAHSGNTFVLTTSLSNSATCNSVIANTVSITGTGDELSFSDNSSVVSQQISCGLSLVKEDNIACAIPGQLIDYAITVTNSTPGPANNLVLTEFLPANTTFQGPVGVWTPAGGNTFTHTIGTLNSGQVDTTGFSAQVATSTTASAITNVVTLAPSGLTFVLTTPITSSAPDLYVIKNDNIELLSAAAAATIARLEQKLGPLPWLETVKGQGLDAQAISAAPGDVISYTLAFGNAGTSPATNVVISETLPANTTFLGPAYWTAVNANTYVYTISTLLPGNGGNLDFRVRVANPFPAGTIGVTNTVQIAGAGLSECDTGNNISREFTRIETAVSSTAIYLPIIHKNGQSFPPPGPTPTPSPTPTPLAYVSDVKADPDTNQVFVASPRHDWVYVINGSTDTVTRTVAVGHGPTGLTVLDASTAANNKVFVAHQFGANNWRPGFMAFGVNDTVAHNTADGGYAGAAPIKTAANAAHNNRVYVSNYFDKLAVFNGNSGPPEARLGWVIQKAFQGAYGIDTSTTTNRVYLATRDTGELVVFDGNNDRLLQSNYIPTHVKPPQACSLWSVAVNETTGHVFVPCPQLSKVFVLQENQVSVLDLETLGVLEERNGFLALVVSPQAAPWLTDISIPSGTGLGEEGIGVDSSTGRVFITNGHNNSLVILQDGATPAYVTTVAVGTKPQGVDVNPATQKAYVGNTGSNSVTVLNATSPFSTIKTILLAP